MDDLSNLLISSGIGCFLDKVCFNHVFYADDLCLMAPCAIAPQELLNICHSYSITVDVNFNALKSFCVAFTPKLFKLRFPELNINAALIPYTDSIKYLGFTFTNSQSFCGSFYCSYLWTHYNKASFSKIRVAYNDLYRKILHVSRRSSASAMFVNNNIPTFERLIRRDIFSFTSRLKVSTNKLISTIENCWLLKYVI